MTDFQIDTAWTISKGQRDVQEDVLHLWFEPDARAGYIIIADGMGGHTSGDIASSLVVEAVDNKLTALWAQNSMLEKDMQRHLPKLVDAANTRLAQYIKTSPNTAGMGSTLLTAIILKGRLFWASVGDSPLYLVRDNKRVQLNEDHSMACQIDQMVHAGQLTKKAAQEHPNRNALTSVIMGDEIAHTDCQASGLELQSGDILIAATDGILSLSDQDLITCMAPTNQTAEKIAASITKMIDALAHSNQDNLAVCVARIL